MGEGEGEAFQPLPGVCICGRDFKYGPVSNYLGAELRL